MSATILIAEDDLNVRELISEVLTREGYRVLSVADGDAVLRLLAEESIDLLIADLRMPKLGGRELIQSIRQQEGRGKGFSISPLEIIVLTGYPEEFDEGQAWREYDVFEYIEKPVTNEHLLRTVAHSLDRKRLREENALHDGTVDKNDLTLWLDRTWKKLYQALTDGDDVATELNEFAEQFTLCFYGDKRDCEEALRTLEKWLDRKRTPAALEIAGHVLLQYSHERQQRFCEKYNLFPRQSTFLSHDELINSDLLRDAGEYFQQAAEGFRALEKTDRETACLHNAIVSLHDDEHSSEKLKQLGQRLRGIDPNDFAAAITIETTEEFKRLKPGVPPLTWQPNVDAISLAHLLIIWARATDNAALVAEFLTQAENRQKFDTVEQQATLTIIRIELWHRENRSDKAWEVLRAFKPPPAYGYLPLILRSALHAFDSDLTNAEKVLSEAQENHPNHPEVLAYACGYWARAENWERGEETARKLLDVIPIPQTFQFYLDAVGNLQKWVELLEALERAKSKGIELRPRWRLINRARALLALDRDTEAQPLLEEARALSKEGKLSFEPSDWLYLADSYRRTGHLERALAETEELVKRYPGFSNGHQLLAQLLLESSDREKAFRAAKEAAGRFPDNEAILGQFMHIGWLSGHSDEATIAMQTIVKRFPNSKAIQQFPKAYGLEIYRQSLQQAQQGNDSYRSGRIPALWAAYYASGINSFFRFWHATTRSRSGLYVASGEQGEEWKQVAEIFASPAPVVMDFSACVTAFELWGADWYRRLADVFSEVYMPQSFRSLLTVERAELATAQVQPDIYQTRKQLRQRIDVLRNRFVLLPVEQQSGDALGHTTLRDYAAKSRLFYLSEYDDEGRIAREFGFQELAILLKSIGHLTSVQERRILGGATPREPFVPVDALTKAGGEIVADVMTLETLMTEGLLDAVIEHFDKIYISEQGYWWLVGEINTYEFSEEIYQRFRHFEATVREAEDTGWLGWVAISDEESTLWQKTGEREEGDRYGVYRYVCDLLDVARKKKSPILTDDRSTKRFRLPSDNPKVRFGADTLLRFLYHTERIDRDTFLEHYHKLIQWNYRHLPPEPAYLVDRLPTEESSTSTTLDEAMKYYRESFTEFKDLAKGSEIYQHRVDVAILEGYGNGLANALRMAHVQGYSPTNAAHLIKGVAWCFYLDEFKGRVPEYLISLLNRLASSEDIRLKSEDVGQLRDFWEWVDQALQQAGISQDDIDRAQSDIISQYLTVNLPQVKEVEERTVRARLIAHALDVLPERSRVAILNSSLGKKLAQQFGWTIEDQYRFTVQQGEEDVEVILTEGEIEAAAVARLRSRSDEGIEEILLGEKRVWVRHHNPDSFFALMDFFPYLPQVSPEGAQGVSRVVNIFSLFRHQDRDFRQRAWETGLAKVRQSNQDVELWEHHKGGLLSRNEPTWRDAAEKCIRQLLGDEEIATSIFAESVQGGSVSLLELIRELRPQDVQQWFPLPSPQWDKKNESHPEKALRDWAQATSQKFRDNWDDLYRLRCSAYYSLFPDIHVFREHVVEGFRRNCRDPRTMKDWANRLLVEAEKNPSPIYKINIVLTLLEWARPLTNTPSEAQEATKQERQFWRHISPGGRSKSAQRRAGEVLSQALAFRADEIGETAFIGLGEALSGVLSLVWTREENLTMPMRSYFATVVSGFLTAKLVESNAFRSAEHVTATCEDLSRIELRDEAPGLFRPALARYLRYPVAFAVHALRGRESTVQAYLMNDDLQKQLLDIGEWYRLVSGFLGDAETLKPTWLDAALDQSPTAGVDTFLRDCAGTSLAYWKSADRERLERLSDFKDFDHDGEISGVLQQIGDADDATVLWTLQILGFFLSLGAHAAQRNWGKWLQRLLEESILKRLAYSPNIYRSFVLSLVGMLVRPELDDETRAAFRNLLLTPADQLHSPEQLAAHAVGLVYLLQNDWRDDAVGEWLDNVANDDGLAFELRRNCLSAFTEAWHQLPAEVRTQLDPVLVNLAQTPPWNAVTETILFRRASS